LEALGIFDLLSCEYIPHHRDGQVAFHARSVSSEWTTLALLSRATMEED
jgi:hypothetical protein